MYLGGAAEEDISPMDMHMYTAFESYSRLQRIPKEVSEESHPGNQETTTFRGALARHSFTTQLGVVVPSLLRALTHITPFSLEHQ